MTGQHEISSGDSRGTELIVRLGSTPFQRGSTTGATCPDVFSLSGSRLGTIAAHVAIPLMSLKVFGRPLRPQESVVAVDRLAVLEAVPDMLRVQQEAGEELPPYASDPSFFARLVAEVSKIREERNLPPRDVLAGTTFAHMHPDAFRQGEIEPRPDA